MQSVEFFSFNLRHTKYGHLRYHSLTKQFFAYEKITDRP
jgi:hypothetical protein